MANIRPTPPALLLAAVFSSRPETIVWARQQIQARWGEVVLESSPFEHVETEYYADEMGQPIVKQFFVVEKLFDPACLADCKVQSNAWESELSQNAQFDVPRPVNIDPGYLMLGKLVLASTKDRAHRIYLRGGIYAEECLYYVGGWQSRPWTYPDYQRADYQEFFSKVRELLKSTISKNQAQPPV